MLNFSKIKIFSITSICFLALLFAIPTLLNENSAIARFFPKNKINLGLDLQGGSQLLLEVDFDYYKNEQQKNLKNTIKKSLQEEAVRASALEDSQNNLFVEIHNDYDEKLAKELIFKANEDIETKQINDKIYINFSRKQLEKFQKDIVSQSIEIIRRRVDENGTKEPIIQVQGDRRILLQVPGVESSDEIKNLLGTTAKMTFHFVFDRAINKETIRTNVLNFDLINVEGEDGSIYMVEKDAALSGELLTDANPTYFEGAPAVAFRFNQEGTKKFAKLTSENIGRIFAIVLDNKVITAPKINTIINQGSGVITGNFTTKEATDLALLLRAGALPAPLKIVEERTIGPSLGLDSIKNGAFASIISLILISATMLIVYRSFGIIANIALIINIAMILSILSLINATLTLPGIAGIALTMGMSVDANVLIFERIKEEIRLNNSIFVALENGFSGAFKAIIDSNITTLIIALFLYIFGSGPVKGFAVTLSIGILSSMFCAILLTRMIIILWIRKTKQKKLSIA